MRAIYKTILYRLVATSSTFIITYLVLQSLWVPTILTVAHESVHSIIYYVFERKIKSPAEEVKEIETM